MTPIPEKTPPTENAELVEVVYYLRARIEQLEETIHDLLLDADERRDTIQAILEILAKITTILERR